MTEAERIQSLQAEIERLQHENATCASALMIAEDARHKAEKERAEMEAAACDTVEKLYSAEGRAEAAEARANAEEKERIKYADYWVKAQDEEQEAQRELGKMLTRAEAAEAELAALRAELEKRK